MMQRIVVRASPPGAQYVTLDNKIKCLRLAVFFFLATLSNKTAYTWGPLIANHLEQSL
jgi:hypothetical protein